MASTSPSPFHSTRRRRRRQQRGGRPAMSAKTKQQRKQMQISKLHKGADAVTDATMTLSLFSLFASATHYSILHHTLGEAHWDHQKKVSERQQQEASTAAEEEEEAMATSEVVTEHVSSADVFSAILNRAPGPLDHPVMLGISKTNSADFPSTTTTPASLVVDATLPFTSTALLFTRISCTFFVLLRSEQFLMDSLYWIGLDWIDISLRAVKAAGLT
ncbi:unnamed protein product [Caenorhabditis auriculariae]|uniref:Uncharacterized protein n=1 Tax=Caenorhabditis auriculariae TaxID=2777116 RepID=A0A8S1HYE2_9PELO|nr:unnamed protein product [Caenorhabditis auriculariae]